MQSNTKTGVAAPGGALRPGRGLVNTASSPHVRLRSVDMSDVLWTHGFWADKFDQCAKVMVPNMWQLLSNTEVSFAYHNFLVAAGRAEGRHRGPKWNDGDFYKWLEAAAYVYGMTKDETLDRLMDEIIEVIGEAQREDGYLHTPVLIEQRQGIEQAREFAERLDFETYNLGHLMTTACVHFRATGKTNLLDVARKATDYLYDYYETATAELARNAICPSHYMGVVEMYRTTGEERYLELAKNLIEIRDLFRRAETTTRIGFLCASRPRRWDTRFAPTIFTRAWRMSSPRQATRAFSRRFSPYGRAWSAPRCTSRGHAAPCSTALRHTDRWIRRRSRASTRPTAARMNCPT